MRFVRSPLPGRFHKTGPREWLRAFPSVTSRPGPSLAATLRPKLSEAPSAAHDFWLSRQQADSVTVRFYVAGKKNYITTSPTDLAVNRHAS